MVNKMCMGLRGHSNPTSLPYGYIDNCGIILVFKYDRPPLFCLWTVSELNLKSIFRGLDIHYNAANDYGDNDGYYCCHLAEASGISLAVPFSFDFNASNWFLQNPSRHNRAVHAMVIDKRLSLQALIPFGRNSTNAIRHSCAKLAQRSSAFYGLVLIEPIPMIEADHDQVNEVNWKIKRCLRDNNYNKLIIIN